MNFTKTTKWRACAIMAAIAIALTAGAGGVTGAAAADDPFKIVTTCGMVTDIVRVVAGDKGEVTGLMGEGVDPHLYKPTRGDVAKILAADIIFYSGLMLEGRMTDTFFKAARKGKPVYPVTELIEESFLLEPKEFAGHWDPHVWMDVSAWSMCVAAVAKALGEFDPPNAAYYKANADAYGETLAELHAYIKDIMKTIPAEQRVLITAHDAFNYFGRAYGIDVMGIQGISTESEAGLDDINRLVDLIVEKNIAAVFVETSVSEKNVKALIEGARARGHAVKIGGKLFSDAMGAPGTYEGTYIGMLEHNAATVVRALGGKVPASGFKGKLSHAER